MSKINIHELVIKKQNNTLAELLELGADPNCVLDEDKITPLHLAAQHNALYAAKILVCAGANVTAMTSPDGLTPFAVAKLHHHKVTSDFLSKLHLYYCL